MKAHIDKYIERNYQKLLNIAKSYIQHFNRSIEAEDLVSAAYENVIERPPNDKEDIERFLVANMRQETRFTMSKTNRKNKCQAYNEVLEDSTKCTSNTEQLLIEIDFKTIYVEWRSTLERDEQNIADAYFFKGKTQIKELANHFDINYNTFYQEYRDTIDKIKFFEYEIKKEIRRT